MATVSSFGPGIRIRHHTSPNGTVYDFRTREWQVLPTAPIAARSLSLTWPAEHGVYVWGGWVGEGTFCRDGAFFDFHRNTRERTPDLPEDIPMALHPGW